MYRRISSCRCDAVDVQRSHLLSDLSTEARGYCDKGDVRDFICSDEHDHVCPSARDRRLPDAVCFLALEVSTQAAMKVRNQKRNENGGYLRLRMSATITP